MFYRVSLNRINRAIKQSFFVCYRFASLCLVFALVSDSLHEKIALQNDSSKSGSNQTKRITVIFT